MPETKRSITRTAGVLCGTGLLVTVMLLPTGAGAATAARAAKATAAPHIVPKPVSTVRGRGTFVLHRHARISASGPARAVARDLAKDLRPATGFRLPVSARAAKAGDITLRLAKHVRGLKSDAYGEGYRLDVTRHHVTATAPTAHGLFDAVQTIRQLLPPSIDSANRQHTRWVMPAVHVLDHPRYGYRGFMLDIARHYQSPTAVKRLLNRISEYKINTFHLHLSDDQGFRIAIKGFPRLTRIGSRGSVGTEGRTKDPGGFWTRAQYRSVVAYAAARFITVVPEVDTPGHNNAIIMSEYGDTSNPKLDSHPQDINCSTKNPPQWNYTGDVGFSAMCPESRNTWTILTAIISQLNAMSHSPYYDLGGDEVPNTVLSQARYASLVSTESGIVNGLGKTAMGWAEIAGPGTKLARGSVAEYWNPASGSEPDTATATEAVAKHLKLVMAPANHAYVDQKYAPDVPKNLGQNWACENGCDIDQFYNWDPATYVDGVPARDVLGVEAAMWTETTRTPSQVDEMVFPRLLAIAELGWSPHVHRTATSAAYRNFLHRLAAQGPRLEASHTRFYHSPEVHWR